MNNQRAANGQPWRSSHFNYSIDDLIAPFCMSSVRLNGPMESDDCATLGTGLGPISAAKRQKMAAPLQWTLMMLINTNRCNRFIFNLFICWTFLCVSTRTRFMLKWIDLKCRNHPASLEHVQTRNWPSLRLITQVEHHTAASQVPPGTKVSPCWFFFFSWKYENCRDKRKWWAWDGHCLQHFGGRSCNSF